MLLILPLLQPASQLTPATDTLLLQPASQLTPATDAPLLQPASQLTPADTGNATASQLVS